MISVGDVVQIDPAHDEIFGGTFLTVTEVKSWGVQGYVKSLEPGVMLAYYRVKFDKIVKIGKAEWISGRHTDEEDEDANRVD